MRVSPHTAQAVTKPRVSGAGIHEGLTPWPLRYGLAAFGHGADTGASQSGPSGTLCRRGTRGPNRPTVFMAPSISRSGTQCGGARPSCLRRSAVEKPPCCSPPWRGLRPTARWPGRAGVAIRRTGSLAAGEPAFLGFHRGPGILGGAARGPHPLQARARRVECIGDFAHHELFLLAHQQSGLGLNRLAGPVTASLFDPTQRQRKNHAEKIVGIRAAAELAERGAGQACA